jgi:hypothetical protein
MDTQRAANMETSDSPVHLISWNVASWKPTLDKIDKLCGGLEVGRSIDPRPRLVYREPGDRGRCGSSG